jgi:hypothetical protein
MQAAEYAVVAEVEGKLEVLAEAATPAAVVAVGRTYPGSLLAYRDGSRWRTLDAPTRRAG